MQYQTPSSPYIMSLEQWEAVVIANIDTFGGDKSITLITGSVCTAQINEHARDNFQVGCT